MKTDQSPAWWTFFVALGLILLGGILIGIAVVINSSGDQGNFGRAMLVTGGAGLAIAGAISLGFAMGALLLGWREDRS